MNIAQIREKYPQYSDLSDKDLADRLHAKFYSDMPIDDFYGRIGLQQEPKSEAEAEAEAKSGSAVQSFLRGVSDPVTGLAQLARQSVPESVRSAVDSADRWLGEATGGAFAPLTPENVLASEVAYQQSRGPDAGTFDPWRLAGSIPPAVALTRGLPLGSGARSAAGYGAAGGGLLGAASPVYDEEYWPTKAAQVGVGAAVGAPAGALSRVIMPKSAQDAGLQKLRREGVQPTVGQSLGGVADTVEQKAMSIPIMGDAIRIARERAKEQFNRAAINRVLAPLGKKTDKIGHEGVEEATIAVNNAYNNALAKLGPLKLDQKAKAGIRNLSRMAANLPKDQRRQFDKYVSENLYARVSTSGGMISDVFKKIESELSEKSAKYGASPLASEKDLGRAFTELQNVMRGMAARQNPKYARELSKANRAFSNLVRVQNAAARAINQDGVFTPGQLNLAVRAADRTVRKNKAAQGKALMQDLSSPGQRVLGNTVPNSGTTDRALLALGAVGAGAIEPMIPAGLLGGAAMYSSPVQRLLSAAATQRPAAAQTLEQLYRPYAPLAALPLLQAINEAE